MRSQRAGRRFLAAFTFKLGWFCALCVLGALLYGRPSPARAQMPPAGYPAAATASTGTATNGAAPLYRIVGYEQREEALLKSTEYRTLLGPAGYRQWVASRVLLIIGGVAAFSGAMALLATLGSLAQNSDYGDKSVFGYADGYKNYVTGFSSLFAVGG